MDKKPKKETGNQVPSLKSEISRLSSGIKKANEMYDQSIAAISAWKEEQNKEIDEMEKQIELRYGGTVIDEDMLKRQNEAEIYEQQVQEQIRKNQEKQEALSRKINNLLRKTPENK